MLGLHLGRRRRQRPPGDGVARTRRDRFAFAGVGFEILSSPARAGDAPSAPLADDYLACTLPLADAEVVADVMCSIRVEAVPAEPAGPQPVHWEVEGDRTRVEAPGVDALLHRVGPTRFALTALLRPRPDTAGALLRGASAAVLQQQGGVSVHAAGVELDGEAVLFTGPSGAGKSTATMLTAGARYFAHDHVALSPRPGGGWLAWGLPGGTPSGAPMSARRVLPLRAVLRVRKGSDRPSFRVHGGAEALFLMREAVESEDCSPASEEARLATVMRLASDIPVGTASTVLGQDMTGELRRFLESVAG